MPPKKIKVTCEKCGEEREIVKPAVMPEFCWACHLKNQRRLLGVIVNPREFGFVPNKNKRK